MPGRPSSSQKCSGEGSGEGQGIKVPEWDYKSHKVKAMFRDIQSGKCLANPSDPVSLLNALRKYGVSPVEWEREMETRYEYFKKALRIPLGVISQEHFDKVAPYIYKQMQSRPAVRDGRKDNVFIRLLASFLEEDCPLWKGKPKRAMEIAESMVKKLFYNEGEGGCHILNLKDDKEEEEDGKSGLDDFFESHGFHHLTTAGKKEKEEEMARGDVVCLCLRCLPLNKPEAFHIHGQGNVDAPVIGKCTGSFYGPVPPPDHPESHACYGFEVLYHLVERGCKNMAKVLSAAATIVTCEELEAEISRTKQCIYRPLFESYLTDLGPDHLEIIVDRHFEEFDESIIVKTFKAAYKPTPHAKLLCKALAFREQGEYIQCLISSPDNRYNICICSEHMKPTYCCKQCSAAAADLKGKTREEFIAEHGWDAWMQLPHNKNYSESTFEDLIGRSQVEIPPAIRKMYDAIGPVLGKKTLGEIKSTPDGLFAGMTDEEIKRLVSSAMGDTDKKEFERQMAKYQADLKKLEKYLKGHHI